MSIFHDIYAAYLPVVAHGQQDETKKQQWKQMKLHYIYFENYLHI